MSYLYQKSRLPHFEELFPLCLAESIRSVMLLKDTCRLLVSLEPASLDYSTIKCLADKVKVC